MLYLPAVPLFPVRMPREKQQENRHGGRNLQDCPIVCGGSWAQKSNECTCIIYIYIIQNIQQLQNIQNLQNMNYGTYTNNNIFETFEMFRILLIVRTNWDCSKVFWCVWCKLYYKLIFWIWYSDSVSLSVYMKLNKCDFLKKQMSQKCEQFSYEISLGICLGFLFRNGPLTIIFYIWILMFLARHF